MTHRTVKLVDMEVTVGIAVDSDMTMEQITQWVSDAISAKLDAEREMEDWGGGECRVYPNGEHAYNPHLAGAR